MFEDDAYVPSPPVTKRARCGRQLSPVASPWVDTNGSAIASAADQSGHQSFVSHSPALEAPSSVSSDDLHRSGSSSPLKAGQWVDAVVQQMLAAADMDDARRRAAGLLEAFEREFSNEKRSQGQESKDTSADFQEEQVARMSAMQEQVLALSKENYILKRAVAIQHERQKEHQVQSEEISRLRNALAEKQEHVQKLEVTNYALNLHLQQANAARSFGFGGRINPDIF